MFLRKWEPIEGRIVASETHRVSTGERGHRTVQNKYVVEYSIDGGNAQRVELKQATYWRGSMKMINPPTGSTVPLLLHRKSGKVRFDAKDPQINEKAAYERDQTKRDKNFQDALKG